MSAKRENRTKGDYRDQFNNSQRTSLGPRWRWITASNRAFSLTAKRPIWDDDIRLLVQFIRGERGRSYRAKQRKQYDDWYEGFRFAHSIYSNANPRDRKIAEVLIAGGCSAPSVAQTMAVPEEAIEIFIRCFFDIAEIRSARDAMICSLEMLDEGMDRAHIRLLKTAYSGGSAIAEVIASDLSHLGQSHDLSTEEGRRREKFEIMIALDQPNSGFQDMKGDQKLIVLETLKRAGHLKTVPSYAISPFTFGKAEFPMAIPQQDGFAADSGAVKECPLHPNWKSVAQG